MGGWGAITTVQMHYNESRSYPEADVEEKSSAPVAFRLLAPGSLKIQKSGCCVPWASNV